MEPPSQDEMAGRIARYGQSHLWLVAEVGGEIAGYAYGSPHMERAAYAPSCNVGIYLAPAQCGLGIGRGLYAALLPGLRDRGFHAAFAGISLPNPASIALHERFGFALAGIYREVGWKQERWIDVGWWQRLLSAPIPV